MAIFSTKEKISEEGIYIKYDSKNYSLAKLSTIFPKSSIDVFCLKINDSDHIITFFIGETAYKIFVKYDEEEEWYLLINIETEEKDLFERKFQPVGMTKTNQIFILKSLEKQYRDKNPRQYTEEFKDEILLLESCQTIIDEEKKKSEEKKNIKEQLELWDMCIEAEQKMLVDTPFNCIGFPEVKKKHIDFYISEYIACSEENIIEEIEALIGEEACEINESGNFIISYESLKSIKQITTKNLEIEEIISCEADIKCDGHWNARDFKDTQSSKGRKIKYGKYNDNTSLITITLLNIKSTDDIDAWINDINNFLDFSGHYYERDIKCCIKITLKRIEEKEERKARIKNLSRTEFYTDEDGIGTIGTLDSNNSDYGKLRIILPQDKEEASKIREIILGLTEKGISITTIAPNLIKEAEILKRERNAVNKVRNGDSLKNERIKDFIFNSSKAKATAIFENIDISETEEFKECQKLALLDLNTSQEEAVVKSLYAEDLCLLQGPPGTGKTTVIAELIWQHIRKNQTTRIMLTSQTNLAIDNALSRLLGEFVKSTKKEMWRYMHLIKPLRIADSENVDEEGLPFYPERIDQWVIEGGEENTNNVVSHWMQNISRRINTEAIPNCSDILKEWQDCLNNPTYGLKRAFAEAYKDNYNILGMTCGKVESSDFRNNKGYDGFDVVIIDEASKATPPELLMPLCFAKKSVIIGDHRQLPPFIPDFKEKLLSLETDRARELANKLDPEFVETSLFKRLITNENISNTIKATFNQQYRMHNQINAVIEQFYKEDSGGLKCGLDKSKVDKDDFSEKQSRYHGFTLPGILNPNIHTIWIDVPDGIEHKENGSFYNEKEVEAIDLFINCLTKAAGFSDYFNYWNNCDNIEQRNTEGKIGIISFYAKQVEKLRSISQSIKDKYDIKSSVASVDRYQGQERGIVIVSTVRTNKEGFTKSPERLNVALSRARRLLVVVGNSNFFSEIKDKNGVFIYKNVINQIKENQGFINYNSLKDI